MTAVSLSQVPNGIVTLEQLAVWSGLALASCYPQLGVKEAENRTEYAASAILFPAADGYIREIIRLSIPMQPGVYSDRSKKFWMFADELGQVGIPAGFLAN